MAQALGALAVVAGFFYVMRDEDLKNKHRLLWKAAKDGIADDEEIKEIIRTCKDSSGRIDLNQKNSQGDSLLHLAIKSRNYRIAQLLVVKGNVDVHAPTEDEEKTPLHLASEHGAFTLVRLFVLDYKVDVSARDKSKCTPLYLACCHGHVKVAQFLIQVGRASTEWHYTVYDFRYNMYCDLPFGNTRDDRVTGTLLHHALHFLHGTSCLQMVQCLVEEGNANLFTTDANGNTPFFVACGTQDLDLVQWFIQHNADVLSDDQPQNNKGETPLHKAFYSGHVPVIKFLVGQTWTTKIHPLHTTDHKGNLPMHFMGHLYNISDVEMEQLVDWLVVHKQADFTARNRDGETPFHKAVKCKSPELVTALAKHVDVNVRNNDGNTALLAAIQNACRPGYGGAEDDVKIVRCLAKLDKVNLNVANKDKKTALHLTIKDKITDLHETADRKDVVEALLQGSTINVNARDKFGDALLHKACYLGKTEFVDLLVQDKRTNMNLSNYARDTPLHIACRRENLSIAKRLIQGGIAQSLKTFNKVGDLPIHLACRSRVRHGRWHQYGCDALDLVGCLVEYGPTNVNLRGKEGNTPVHIACELGRLDLLQCLVNNAKPRVDVNVSNQKKDTPVHLACRQGRLDLLQCLMAEKSPYTQPMRSGTRPFMRHAIGAS